MFTTEEPMTLANLRDGSALELFDESLQEVLDNIVDPNTRADLVREIILKVKIKPNEDRNSGVISIQCLPKLAPHKEVTTSCMLGKIGRRGEAREIKSTQEDLFPKEDTKKVVHIEDARKED